MCNKLCCSRSQRNILERPQNKKGAKLNLTPLADRTGLEPATSGVTGRHSNQLNYRSNCRERLVFLSECKYIAGLNSVQELLKKNVKKVC